MSVHSRLQKLSSPAAPTGSALKRVLLMGGAGGPGMPADLAEGVRRDAVIAGMVSDDYIRKAVKKIDLRKPSSYAIAGGSVGLVGGAALGRASWPEQ